MWEKINKVQAQVIACMIIIIGCLGLAYLAALKGISQPALMFVNKITDVALFGAIAWLFSMSKTSTPKS